MTLQPPPKAVVIAALSQPLPEDHARVEDRADLIVAALIQYGHLPNPEAPVKPLTEADAEDAGKYIAERSRHPRYIAVTDGWRQIMASEADLNVAVANAERYAGTESEMQDLRSARSIVLRWQAARVGATDG